MKNLLKKITTTCNVLKEQFCTKAADIINIEYTECGYKENDTPPDSGWIPFENGGRISGWDKHYWFKLKFKTPICPEGKQIVLSSSTGFEGQRNTLNPQSMVFLNGKLTQALDTNHTTVRLDGDTEYTIHIYYYMGMVYESCEFHLWLSYIDERAKKLYYDLLVPAEACKLLNENSYEYIATLKALDIACNFVDLNYPYTENYYNCIEKAEEYLEEEFYDKLCGNSVATVNCIGHTHIDVAWLWTLAQTREKVQRSFATALELMKQYPEYKFMMSQPQLFKYLSEVALEMYEEIKQKIKEGRWEIDGAMWLEADCNLTSGESLIRQILHGKRFLKKEFNIESEILWLPDVFGYSAAIPQILNKSGVKHFVTSKISWNDTNILPYDTFMWQGIDGSEILTNFITARHAVKDGKIHNPTDYVGYICPSMVKGAWDRYQQKDYNDEVMLVYGWGDGGGGPTAGMLERQRRLAYGLPGIPKTRMTSAKEHLEHVKDNFDRNCEKIGRTPKWVGELYLEFHRGTYTSMAKSKRYNRKAELLMQQLEHLSTINTLMLGREYKKQELYSMWDTILLNQFHDIIPGSSIKEVYADSYAQYEALFAKGNEMRCDALSEIAANTVADRGMLVYNSLGFERKGTLMIEGVCYETENVPSMGWAVVELQQSEDRVILGDKALENDFFTLKLDDSGRITQLYDKRAGRDVIGTGALANEIQIFEDIPAEYENWELANYYKSKCKILDEKAEILPIDEGARKGFKIIHKYMNSTLVQRIYIYNSIERIDVENEFDWKESRQIVKIAVPTAINTTKATYEIQFGNVERNTHENTDWDKSKFEVCGQKWIDVSEYGYGVSLLNDCKYGFNVENGIMKLTALKCGRYPNPEADRCMHKFSYSIYPHKGSFQEGGTVKEAYSFNQPLVVAPICGKTGCLPEKFSFVECDNEGAVIETVKQAEDSNEVIIRLYDSFGGCSAPTLKFGLPIKSVKLADMMENPLKEIEVDDNTVRFKLGKFEIVTLKVEF